MKTLFLIACVGMLPLQAATLGDAIDAAKEASKAEEPVVASGQLDRVECVIHEATVCSALVLPDSMLSGKTIKSGQGGHVVLFVSGKFTNKGDKRTSMDTPQLRSAGGKTYEGKDLYFKGVDAKDFSITLNPDEEYRFAAYYLVPADAIVGCKLLLKKDNPFARGAAEIDLKLDLKTEVLDELVKKGVTDNSFDADDDDADDD